MVLNGRSVFGWVSWLVEVYIWAIIVRIVASWFNPSPYNSLVRLWFEVTDPAMAFLERLVPPVILRGNTYDDLPIMVMLMALVLSKITFRLLGQSASA